MSLQRRPASMKELDYQIVKAAKLYSAHTNYLPRADEYLQAALRQVIIDTADVLQNQGG